MLITHGRRVKETPIDTQIPLCDYTRRWMEYHSRFLTQVTHLNILLLLVTAVLIITHACAQGLVQHICTLVLCLCSLMTSISARRVLSCTKPI